VASERRPTRQVDGLSGQLSGLTGDVCGQAETRTPDVAQNGEHEASKVEVTRAHVDPRAPERQPAENPRQDSVIRASAHYRYVTIQQDQ
jgi:hypothetical protein